MEFYLPTYLDIEPDIDKIKEEYSELFAKIIYRAYYKIYQRTRLSEAQNHRCCWCGMRMNNIKNDPISATIEHIIPRSKGGAYDMENYAISCRSCNTRRGSLSVDEFMSVIEGQCTLDHEQNKNKLSKAKMKKELDSLGVRYLPHHSNRRLKSKLDRIYIKDAVDKNLGNIFTPDTRRYKKYEKFSTSLKVRKVFDNNESNIFESGSKEYYMFENLRLEQIIKHMIEHNEPNIFEAGSKEYRKYERLKSKI